MYNPTARLLTLLELLQAHPTLSGAELARRLEVEPRTVRRYILLLQDLGIPVEAIRGPGGGYQLRPGFKLPPLLFTEEEATAIVLGLLGTARLEIDWSAVGREGALAKVLRVLPVRARERLQGMTAHLLVSGHRDLAPPDVRFLLAISEAIQQRQRLQITYRAGSGETTTRVVEPYGLAAWWERWYLIGYCGLRGDFRVFRLDRITAVQVLRDTFARRADFDLEGFLVEHLVRQGARWHVAVELLAPLAVVQGTIPASYGTLTPTERGTLFEYQDGNLARAAHYLLGLDLPLIVRAPPELRAELRQLAEQLLRAAEAT